MSSYRAQPGDGVVWITGASSGIGRAVALALARRGFTVVVSARRAEALAELVAEASAGKIITFPLDVGDPAATRVAADEIEARYGPIALAFFNAGVGSASRNTEIDADAFHATYAVNVRGVVEGLAGLLPLMIARQHGQIAINASLVGYGGLPRTAAYGASKAALINLAESLKFDGDRNNVTIQIVNPGFVDTAMTRRNNTSMPFLLTVEDAAERVVRGFARGGFEIAFPWPMALIVKFVSALPYRLYFPVVAAITGWKRSKPN
ncbi:SDR family NAD(P)-dependent oxidoreductase [Terrarubrum flagellatum]|uniref:SDR family NAD(P)-dependent oxidoreductase n=1 Tax=Terrirubrum flagellatum TaxID=2895980 RepID=UPI003144E475